MTKQDNGLLGRETIAECIYVKKENKSCKCISKCFCLSEINSNKDEEKKKERNISLPAKLFY